MKNTMESANNQRSKRATRPSKVSNDTSTLQTECTEAAALAVSPTLETVSNPGIVPVSECRRSSRKKIIKFDVRDLLNKNRKPHKIQIEARIDSNVPSKSKISSGAGSNESATTSSAIGGSVSGDLSSKQKAFMEKSAIFRRFSISQEQTKPPPPPIPPMPPTMLGKVGGEKDSSGNVMIKPKQTTSLIVAQMESNVRSVESRRKNCNKVIITENKEIPNEEPQSFSNNQQQKKRGRPPKFRHQDLSTTDGEDSANDDSQKLTPEKATNWKEYKACLAQIENESSGTKEIATNKVDNKSVPESDTLASNEKVPMENKECAEGDEKEAATNMVIEEPTKPTMCLPDTKSKKKALAPVNQAISESREIKETESSSSATSSRQTHTKKNRESADNNSGIEEKLIVPKSDPVSTQIEKPASDQLCSDNTKNITLRPPSPTKKEEENKKIATKRSKRISSLLEVEKTKRISSPPTNLALSAEIVAVEDNSSKNADLPKSLQISKDEEKTTVTTRSKRFSSSLSEADKVKRNSQSPVTTSESNANEDSLPKDAITERSSKTCEEDNIRSVEQELETRNSKRTSNSPTIMSTLENVAQEDSKTKDASMEMSLVEADNRNNEGKKRSKRGARTSSKSPTTPPTLSEDNIIESNTPKAAVDIMKVDRKITRGLSSSPKEELERHTLKTPEITSTPFDKKVTDCSLKKDLPSANSSSLEVGAEEITTSAGKLAMGNTSTEVETVSEASSTEIISDKNSLKTIRDEENKPTTSKRSKRLQRRSNRTEIKDVFDQSDIADNVIAKEIESTVEIVGTIQIESCKLNSTAITEDIPELQKPITSTEKECFELMHKSPSDLSQSTPVSTDSTKENQSDVASTEQIQESSNQIPSSIEASQESKDYQTLPNSKTKNKISAKQRKSLRNRKESSIDPQDNKEEIKEDKSTADVKETLETIEKTQSISEETNIEENKKEPQEPCAPGGETKILSNAENVPTTPSESVEVENKTSNCMRTVSSSPSLENKEINKEEEIKKTKPQTSSKRKSTRTQKDAGNDKVIDADKKAMAIVENNDKNKKEEQTSLVMEQFELALDEPKCTNENVGAEDNPSNCGENVVAKGNAAEISTQKVEENLVVTNQESLVIAIEQAEIPKRKPRKSRFKNLHGPEESDKEISPTVTAVSPTLTEQLESNSKNKNKCESFVKDSLKDAAVSETITKEGEEKCFLSASTAEYQFVKGAEDAATNDASSHKHSELQTSSETKTPTTYAMQNVSIETNTLLDILRTVQSNKQAAEDLPQKKNKTAPALNDPQSTAACTGKLKEVKLKKISDSTSNSPNRSNSASPLTFKRSQQNSPCRSEASSPSTSKKSISSSPPRSDSSSPLAFNKKVTRRYERRSRRGEDDSTQPKTLEETFAEIAALSSKAVLEMTADVENEETSIRENITVSSPTEKVEASIENPSNTSADSNSKIIDESYLTEIKGSDATFEKKSKQPKKKKTQTGVDEADKEHFSELPDFGSDKHQDDDMTNVQLSEIRSQKPIADCGSQTLSAFADISCEKKSKLPKKKKSQSAVDEVDKESFSAVQDLVNQGSEKLQDGNMTNVQISDITSQKPTADYDSRNLSAFGDTFAKADEFVSSVEVVHAPHTSATSSGEKQVESSRVSSSTNVDVQELQGQSDQIKNEVSSLAEHIIKDPLVLADEPKEEEKDEEIEDTPKQMSKTSPSMSGGENKGNSKKSNKKAKSIDNIESPKQDETLEKALTTTPSKKGKKGKTSIQLQEPSNSPTSHSSGGKKKQACIKEPHSTEKKNEEGEEHEFQRDGDNEPTADVSPVDEKIAKKKRQRKLKEAFEAALNDKPLDVGEHNTLTPSSSPTFGLKYLNKSPPTPPEAEVKATTTTTPPTTTTVNSPESEDDPLKDIEKFIEDGVNLLKKGYKIDEDSVGNDDVIPSKDLEDKRICSTEIETIVPAEVQTTEKEAIVTFSTYETPADTPLATPSVTPPPKSPETALTPDDEQTSSGGVRRSHRIKLITKMPKALVGRGLVRDKERFSIKDDVETKSHYTLDDHLLDLAEVEAKNAKFLKEMEERLSNFQVIKENEYKCERVISREARKMICDCFLTPEEEERGELACGEDCLNRLLMIECGNECNVKERCTNKRFQKFLCSPCRVFRTEKKGFGIMADIEILPGEFIMEYVGEVIDTVEFERRRIEYSEEKNRHYYFMALRSDAIIDATIKGNISRFINHSCDPNAETQKWTVNGELRIGFFSRKSIMPGEEITFDYQYQRYGREAQRCYCESSNCRGWIGQEPNSDEGEQVDDEDESDDDEEEEDASTNLLEEDDDDSDASVSDPDEVQKKLEMAAAQAEVELAPIPLSEQELEKESPETKSQRQQEDSVKPESEEDSKSKFKKLLSKMAEKVAAKNKQTKREQKKLQRKKKSKESSMDLANKQRSLEDPDIEDEVGFLSRCGLKTQSDTLRLSRLMVRAKLVQTRLNLLSILRKGELPCRRLFLDYHGLRLLHGWMSEDAGNMQIRLALLQTLELLPVANKTVLTDSKVMQVVRNWCGSTNTLSPNEDSLSSNSNSQDGTLQAMNSDSLQSNSECVELQKLASKLITTWEGLPEIFRIPKKERIEQMKEHEREADRQYAETEGDRYSRDQYRTDRFGRRFPTNSRFARHNSKQQQQQQQQALRTTNVTPENSKSLSKTQRREMFAAKVARDEAEKRMAEERREFETKCRFFGLDPKKTRLQDVPFCVNPATGQWYSVERKPIAIPPSYAHVQVPVKPKSTNPIDYQLPAVCSTLPPQWKFAITPLGQIYYYHVQYRIPQWEPPTPAQLQLCESTIDDVDSGNEHTSTTGADSSEDDDEILIGMDAVQLRAYINRKVEIRRQKRYQRLVDERAISPRREEDRIYNQLEVRKYKENKEKIRKRKEEIRRRRSEALRQSSLNMCTLGSLSDATVKLETEDDVGGIVPIQDYLLSSDEDEDIKAEINSPLMDKIVEGEKIVDELDALTTKRPLKRPLPSHRDFSESFTSQPSVAALPGTSTSSERQEYKKRKLEKKEKRKPKEQDAKYRRNKEKFRCEIAGIIVHHLKPYRKDSCTVGRIKSNDDFNHLARKLTHFVMIKELKYCESVGQTLVVTESVKNKSREFIKKYMAKYGDVYTKPTNDPEFKDIPFTL
uniref:[histone H3]-lysine(36) N-trimethyltransferase n=1 Tax=Stomoxys calcitrans TaxID=35570 RepID=A0A1I8NZY3_STOCA